MRGANLNHFDLNSLHFGIAFNYTFNCDAAETRIRNRLCGLFMTTEALIPPAATQPIQIKFQFKLTLVNFLRFFLLSAV